MKIHEYQGKEILKKYGVPVPRGIPAFSVDDALKAAQARHHVGVELHTETMARLLNDHVRHDHVALHVGKAPARARLQARDQRHGGTRVVVAAACGLGQAAQVAPRQQIQRLAADGERGLNHRRVALFVAVHGVQL